MTRSARHFVGLCVLTFSVSLAGCKTTQTKKDTEEVASEEQSAIVETQSVGKLRKEAIDLNNDKQPDIFNYYATDQRRRLVRKESDINFDGKVDVTSHYEDGNLTREEIDADFDGRLDWTDFYQDGKRIRQEADTQWDGKTDTWKFFEEGKVIRKERDLNQDGKPDFFEYYQNDEVIRIGRDTDGDGKEDSYE